MNKHSGRKRGELKISRTTLQHAGSGLWLGMWTAPGNGDWRNYSRKAIARVREVCTTAGLCYERALIRVDGEGGNTPFITGCQEAGLHYLTRIAAYELFDRPAICEYLNAAVWHEVEDSGSGPKRQAVDLGRIQLPCSPKSLREDGTPFAPVMSRVVVARYPSETGRGAGRLLDGWNYELFATDLEAESYVAPEVVTHYYGRSGEENRFRQEDRELGLDRIYSYHIPPVLSQQGNLACILGLFLWNLRICWGVLLGKVPQTLPPQPRRTLVRASTPVELPVVQKASPQPEKLAPMSAKKASGGALTQPLKVIPKAFAPENTEASRAQNEAGAAPRPTPFPLPKPGEKDPGVLPPLSEALVFSNESGSSSTAVGSSPSVTIGAFEALRDALSRQDWTRLVQYQDGWRMSEDPLGLRCANGEVLRLRHVKLLPKGITGILIFRAQEGVCRECPLRASCMRPTTQAGAKGAMLSVPAEQAIELDALLKEARTTARWERDSRTPSVRLKGPPHSIQPPMIKGDSPSPLPKAEPPSKPEKSRRNARRPAGIEAILQTWERPKVPVRGAFLRPVQAILLPAAARRLFRRTCRDVEVEVELILPPETGYPSLLIAETDATRQRRRLTWEQRLVSNALPIGAQVNVELRLPTHAKALLARAPIPHDKARQPVDVEWD